jgi:hypothetical protein
LSLICSRPGFTSASLLTLTNWYCQGLRATRWSVVFHFIFSNSDLLFVLTNFSAIRVFSSTYNGLFYHQTKC